MRDLFNLDSPLMNGLNKMADMMILNLITLVCCIPIITIGASLTAMHYVSLKLVRNEETYIIKGFFKSFKQNFMQSTLLWLFKLLVAFILFLDYKIAIDSKMQLPFWALIGLFAVSVLVFALLLNVFPLQARFENSIFNTIKNSVLVGLLIFPKTMLMVLIWALPVVILYRFEIAWPLVILFGFSFPGFLCALLYNKTFKKLEPEQETAAGDEWTLAPIDGEEEISTVQGTDEIKVIDKED